MRRRRLMAGLSAGAAACVVRPGAFAAADPLQPLAPRMDFTPPVPGSYVLQRIQRCGDSMLIDASGRQVPLAQLTSGKITLLSFFYTYCTDALGCPFAYQTLINLRESLLADPALARRVRFVNISFDPVHDTPEQLRIYGGKLLGDMRFEWRMLSSRTMQELLPLLDDFGQDVSVLRDERGRPTRTRNHMLKLFLVDAQRFVREIYTLDFVQPQVMLGDMRTLAMEG
jgi:protein SCO1